MSSTLCNNLGYPFVCTSPRGTRESYAQRLWPHSSIALSIRYYGLNNNVDQIKVFCLVHEQGKCTCSHQDEAMTCRNSGDRLTCNSEMQEHCGRFIRVHKKQNIMLSRYITIADSSTQEFKDFMSTTYPLDSMRVIGCLIACDSVLDAVLSTFETDVLEV